MSYTIEELVIIQRQAMEIAIKATHMLGQRVHKHGDYPDDVGELQRRFANLHTVMLGDMDYTDGMTRSEAIAEMKLRGEQ